ncbi:GyrI-like domain-containing protein [Aquimarina sp. SS2-1]|uniref:GyrI-like domain-containing protein n=1 Tax=Aquimarina besae TaxID=3342247 RepID=UPI00366E1243
MKKIVVFILVILSGLSIWYLFIKKFDYQVTFTAKGSKGSIYHQIIAWESWGKNSKAKNITTIDTTLFKTVTQQVKLKDTILNLKWTLESVNDSVTKIRVDAFSGKHSMANRLKILTGDSDFTKSLKHKLKNFGKGVNNFARNFRIIIDGESEIPALAYLYVSSTSNRSAKAAMMMQTNTDLYPSILENEVKVDGAPFVRIKEWNIVDDTIQFEFGFPIKYNDSLPINSLIKYDKFPVRKALKATFYGNYRYSDQAWFALMEYAEEKNMEIDKKPFEIFYNNPMQDGNPSQWKAEVYMPLR